MAKLNWRRDILDNVKGMICEAPSLNIAAEVFTQPYTQRVFNMITIKEKDAFVKEKTSIYKNIKQSGFNSFVVQYNLDMASLVNKGRYPGQYSNYYDIRAGAPHTRPKSNNLLKFRPVMFNLAIAEKIWPYVRIYNLDSRQLQKVLNFKRKDIFGEPISHEDFNFDNYEKHAKYYATLNLRKSFKTAINNKKYKFIMTMGEYDNTSDMATLMNYIKSSYTKKRWNKYLKTKWKIEKKYGKQVSVKTVKNLSIAFIGAAGHVISIYRPEVSYKYIRRMVEKWSKN